MSDVDQAKLTEWQRSIELTIEAIARQLRSCDARLYSQDNRLAELSAELHELRLDLEQP